MDKLEYLEEIFIKALEEEVEKIDSNVVYYEDFFNLDLGPEEGFVDYNKPEVKEDLVDQFIENQLNIPYMENILEGYEYFNDNLFEGNSFQTEISDLLEDIKNELKQERKNKVRP